MILSHHDSVCLAQELGEERPGWPIKCLAVPRKLLPVSRERFIKPRQPAGKTVGATRYSRFVTCYPCPDPGALLRSLVDHLEAQRRLPRAPPRRLFETGAHAQGKMQSAECGCYGMTPAEIDLMWQTARPARPSLRPDSEYAKATVARQGNRLAS
jgi:hypothetical protein